MNLTDNKSPNKTVSAIIQTYNEEKNIGACIDSARMFTDKIIVVDMQSTDKTVDLAKKMGAEVFSFPHSSYVEPAREFGIQKANTEWVFLLDTDERITKKVAKEILYLIENEATGEPSRLKPTIKFLEKTFSVILNGSNTEVGGLIIKLDLSIKNHLNPGQKRFIPLRSLPEKQAIYKIQSSIISMAT